MSTTNLRPLAAALLLALLLAACGAAPGGATAPTDAPAATAIPAKPTATTAPAEPTATAEPTAPPTAPAATAEPTAAPTAPPISTIAPVATEAPQQGGLLPAVVPWLRLGDTVAAQGAGGQQLDLTLGGRFAAAFGGAVSPGGRRIAFSDWAATPRRLVVLSAADGSAQTLPAAGPGDASEGRFSPDGRAIVYAVIDQDTWQLRVADLEGGAERVIREGTLTWDGQGAEPPLLPLPVAWTPAGVLAQEVLWATDAPPAGLLLIDPLDGTTLAQAKVQHLAAFPSPDGSQVALVTGVAPPGGPPRQGVRVVELASGAEREVLPEADALVKGVRWAPDGAALLVATAESYEAPVTRLQAMRADGSNVQAVDFGVRGFWLDLRDIAWADAQTPLVLVTNLRENRAELHALPLTSFDATGLRPLGDFALPDDERTDVRILYVPG